MKKSFLKTVSLLLIACMTLGVMIACGGSGSKLKVDADGKYSFPEVKDTKAYVVELYAADDVADSKVKDGAKALAKQTVNTTSGTLKLDLPFGKYVPTVYSLKNDKTTSEVIVGDTLVLGGKLTAPDIVVQRDYGNVKISVTDKSFDEHYFLNEAVYGFTAEVYTSKDCSGKPVASGDFGSDAAYIPPTNSDTPIWIRNRTISFPVANGTYYVRVKANGNAADKVTDSDYSAVKEVVIDGNSTDVKYVTYEYKISKGEANAIGETRIEFGNGKRQLFEHMVVVTPGWVYEDQRTRMTAEEVLEPEDLYTLMTDDGTCLDMHLLGKAGDKTGECYTTCARPMPVDKPDLRGTWTQIDDDTIHIVIMDDFQYFSDPADEKTT